MTSNKQVKVIGAGIAGMAAAARLAAKGFKVMVFEKNDTPGGKLGLLQQDGFTFDTGPSLFTQPYILAAHVKEPTVAILNYLDVGNNQYIAGELNALVRNCIFYGSLEDEAFFDKVDGYGYTLKLENCLLRKKEEMPSYVGVENCILNQDPGFVSGEKWDFHIMSNSPCVGKGKQIGVDKDLEGKTRTVPVDIGCYEY